MELFQATHNQTNEVRQGTFEDLRNLDKRLWTLEEIDDDETEPEMPVPLATINLKMPDAPFEIIQQPIWSHKELVGRYV